MTRVPSKQATHAPRTKTRYFEMDNQRANKANHRCKSMSRTENHVPLKIANTTTGHATRPPTRITSVDQRIKTRNHAPSAHKQTKTQVQKLCDTPPDKFEKYSSSPRNVQNACIGRVPLSRTAQTRNFYGGMSVPIRYEVQLVTRGNATHQSHGRRDVCRTGMKRATTTRGGVSIAHARGPLNCTSQIG